MPNEGGGLVAEVELIKGIERLNVKLDELLRRGDDHEARLRAIEQRGEPEPSPEHAKQIGDHENRLRDVEQWRWKLVGAAAGSGGLGGVVGAALTALFTGGG